MKRDSRRLFSTIEHLGKLSPKLLVLSLHQHPDDFGELIKIGAIPPEDQADKLNLETLIPLLTGTGISQSLGDSLFLINAFASPRNRRILEEEVRNTKPPLALSLEPDVSDADYAMVVWLARPSGSILEAALSRVTLKSRRTFAYFTPSNPALAAHAPAVTDPMLARLAIQLRGALKTSGRSRGVAVIPFLDHPDEDWFLIRRSRLPERITYFDDEDNEVSFSAVLRTYDVVVFDRVTGMLKVNTRDKLQELYRQAFSDMYFSNLSFFVKKNIFTLEPLRSGSIAVVSRDGVEGITAVDLYSVCYTVEDNFMPTRHDVSRKNWYATTTGAKAPVPSDATEINFARFEVHHRGQRAPHRCRVDYGNTLSYCRDDEHRAFETFLRLRGFARGMDALIRENAA
jgi:hypothetical protein